MNRRQNKKFDSKILWPAVDESGLLTMSPEERDDAYEEYRRFARRHCRFFHYRDMSKMTLYRYVYPVKGVFSEPVTFCFFQKQSYDAMSCVLHVHEIGMDVMNMIGDGFKVISFDQISRASEYARLDNAGCSGKEG